MKSWAQNLADITEGGMDRINEILGTERGLYISLIKKLYYMEKSIVLKFGLIWWVDPELKLEKKKPGVTWSKTRLQPVNFCFLLKRCRFDFFFKKKLTRTTRSNPRTQALNRAGHRVRSFFFF